MTDDTRSAATVPCPFCLTLNRVDLGRAGAGPKCGQCGKPLLLDRPIKLGDDDMERVVRDSQVPVVVDFYADWCAPCKMMAPLVDELAGKRKGELLVAKVDTDRSPTMAVRYGIRGIPTLIVFRGGQEIARETGAVSRERLTSLVEAAIDG